MSKAGEPPSAEESGRMTTKTAPVKYPYPRTSLPYLASPELQALIEQGPMVRAALSDGTFAWLVTGYEEVRAVLTDRRFSRNLPANRDRVQRSIEVMVDGPLLALDSRENAGFRRLIAGAFSARRLESLRPAVASIVDALLDDLLSQPRPVDLIEQFSTPLPARVVAAMLGVPAADTAMLRPWSDVLASDWNGDRAAVAAAYRSISDYVVGLIAAKRADPGGDLISALVAARDEAGLPSEHDLAKLIVGLLIVDGHGVTTNQINTSLLILLDHPAQLDLLRRNLDLVPRAVEELLRFGQLGSGSLPARVVTEESTLGGLTIQPGDIVLPLAQAANRDPSVFPDPNRLDLTRAPTPQLAFGAGGHYCLGAQLARLELQEAFRALLGRLPGLRLAIPPEHLRYNQNVPLFNILRELPVTW